MPFAFTSIGRLGLFLGAFFATASAAALAESASAPTIAEVRESCQLTAQQIAPERAYIRLISPAPDAELRHLIVGRINRGDYVHLVQGQELAAFKVGEGVSRPRTTKEGARLRAPIFLSRLGDTVRVYSDGRIVAEVGVPTGVIQIACAWEAPDATTSPWRVRVQDATIARYADDFMRYHVGQNDGWSIDGGIWRISQVAQKGAAPNTFTLLGNAANRPGRLLTGYYFWSNYAIEVSVNVRPGNDCGLLFGDNEAGPYHLAVLRCGDTAGTLELIRVDRGQETVLSKREVAVTDGQWLRLGVRVGEGMPTTVSLDGVTLIGEDLDAAMFGRVGLYARGSRGMFDDFFICGLDSLPDAAPMTSVVQASPTFKDKPYDNRNAHDKNLQRWASDTDAWGPASITVDGKSWTGFINSTLLFADFAVDTSVLPVDHVVALQSPDGDVLFSRRVAAGAPSISLAQHDGGVWLENKRLAPLDGGAGMRVGIYTRGRFPFRADRPTILARGVEEEFFETVPVRWLPISGEWAPTVRWACDPKWSFFGGVAFDDAVLMSKSRYEGNQCHEFYFAMKDVLNHKPPEGGRYVQRDVCFSFCTNGRDLNSGYTFVFGGYRNSASFLMKGDRIVAWNDHDRFPDYHDRNDVYQLHYEWWRLRFERLGRRIRVLWDNNVIIDWTDQEPDVPSGGHIACWTYRNGVLYSRIKSTAQKVENAAATYLSVTGKGAAGGWTAMNPSRVRLEDAPGGRVRVKNLFGGGFFAVRWNLEQPVDLTRTPVLRIPFAAEMRTKVNLHVVLLDGTEYPLVLRVAGPTDETYGVLGQRSPFQAAWQAFVAAPVQAPIVDAAGCLNEKSACIEVNLLEEVRRRLPRLRAPQLKSLIIGNSSNDRYLILGYGGNGSECWYEVGTPEFLPALQR